MGGRLCVVRETRLALRSSIMPCDSVPRSACAGYHVGSLGVPRARRNHLVRVSVQDSLNIAFRRSTSDDTESVNDSFRITVVLTSVLLTTVQGEHLTEMKA
eukprot:396161-Prorocentrum_minimum.AAC.4